jgi:hypothetical protein
MNYVFTLEVSGIDTGRENFEDLPYEARCDDALIAVVDGTMFLDFHREGCRSKTPSNRHRMTLRSRGARSSGSYQRPNSPISSDPSGDISPCQSITVARQRLV